MIYLPFIKNKVFILNIYALCKDFELVIKVFLPLVANRFLNIYVYHQYTIRVEKGNRDDWVDIINDCGVGTGIHYPIPLYNQPIYKMLGIEGDCPNAELAADNVISLPVHPSLTKEDLDLVIKAVKTASDKI